MNIMMLAITVSQRKRNLDNFLHQLDQITESKGLNVPQIVNIEKMRSLPQGTFGRIWADLLAANNLKPFTTGTRRKQLHDGVHVLTGYGTDPIGEIEVQAFLLGAKFTVFNLMLGLGLLRIIAKNHQTQTHQVNWERIWQAYQRGVNSQFDPDTWQPELLWHLPLKEVQALFAVV
jgi:ubiquinone biosynthesis protein COQ4